MGLCLRINDFGLFAWINLTALSRTYFIIEAKQNSPLQCNIVSLNKLSKTIYSRFHQARVMLDIHSETIVGKPEWFRVISVTLVVYFLGDR